MTCTFSGAGGRELTLSSRRATSCKSDIDYWSRSRERTDSQGRGVGEVHSFWEERGMV